MAHMQSQPSKLFARDIVAYSDTELDQYLEANARFVKVEDPENLPEDFIQRLRARAGVNDAAPSRPIDLNYVSARLQEAPADRDTSPQRYSSVSSTAGTSDEEEDYRRDLEREMENYNALINDGGRPSHPISPGCDVAKNMEEYREILSFWKPYPDGPDAWKGVFGCQLDTWKNFRESQRRMRTDGPLEVGRVFPSRPANPGRFAAYCQGLQKRLARHGFERSFQLNEDPDRQDKLATWIEYLGFECVEYDKHANIIKRLQQQHDEAWKKLVDSKILRPLETEESFDYLFWLQLKNEKNGAQKAVESAASTVELAEKVSLKAQSAGLSGQALSQMERKLSAARSKLATVTKSLEQTSIRCELIGDFMDQTKQYRIAKKDRAHQSILLRWILQQVPLIELELNPTKVTKNDSARGNRGRQRMLKRNRADDCNEEPVSKRQRQDGENHVLLEGKTRASTIQETFSTQQARQTRSSRTNLSTIPSNPCSQRALRASRLSNTESDSAKPGVVLDDSARVRKGRQRNKFSLGSTPDSRVLRRSSRPRRPPERFQ